MNLAKKRILMNSFFKPEFNYCPLIWMCHSRNFNNRINRLHERCLPIIYNDKQSTIEELLDRDGYVSIHHQNLQTLAIEMFKVSKGLSPKIVYNLFDKKRQNSYNL